MFLVKRQKRLVHVCTACESTGQAKDEFDMYIDEPCPECKGEGYIVSDLVSVNGEDLRVTDLD